MIEKGNPGRDDNASLRDLALKPFVAVCFLQFTYVCDMMYVRKTFPNPLRITDVIPKMKELFLPPL